MLKKLPQIIPLYEQSMCIGIFSCVLIVFDTIRPITAFEHTFSKRFVAIFDSVSPSVYT